SLRLRAGLQLPRRTVRPPAHARQGRLSVALGRCRGRGTGRGGVVRRGGSPRGGGGVGSGRGTGVPVPLPLRGRSNRGVRPGLPPHPRRAVPPTGRGGGGRRVRPAGGGAAAG